MSMNNIDASIWSESYDLSVPLQVPLTNGQSLTCIEVVRAMPGRRYVFRGIYNNKPVFVKLFSKTSQATREWNSEQQGISALHEANIPAPNIIYSESILKLNAHVIILEELHGAESARDRWQKGNEIEQQQMLSQLVELIAQHHAAGIRQTDCHLLNFVFSGGVLYTLDAADIVKTATELSRSNSMEGLVDLLGVFSADEDKWLASLYEQYWQQRNKPTSQEELEAFKNAVVKMRDYKLRKYLDKTYRDCSAFAVKNSWYRFSTVLREKNNNIISLLVNNPDIESNDIKRSVIKNGNTCTVTLIETPEENVVCKRYNIKNIWHGLMRAFRSSRASISWRNAHSLIKFGIATPAPIALVEKRFGFIRRQAWFFMEHVDGSNAYYVFRDTEQTQQQRLGAVKKFINLFEKMIQAKLSHGDMKITNFIFSDNKLFVIDLDSMQQHHNDTAFSQAFRQDMARFMRNWSDLPTIAALFEEQLSTSSVAEYLPVSIKG